MASASFTKKNEKFAVMDMQRMLKEFASGSSDAFEFIYRHHYNAMLWYAICLTENEKEGSDLVQKSFYNLRSRQWGFDTLAKIQNFLFGQIYTQYCRMALNDENSKVKSKGMSDIYRSESEKLIG